MGVADNVVLCAECEFCILENNKLDFVQKFIQDKWSQQNPYN